MLGCLGNSCARRKSSIMVGVPVLFSSLSTSRIVSPTKNETTRMNMSGLSRHFLRPVALLSQGLVFFAIGVSASGLVQPVCARDREHHALWRRNHQSAWNLARGAAGMSVGQEVAWRHNFPCPEADPTFYDQCERPSRGVSA